MIYFLQRTNWLTDGKLISLPRLLMRLNNLSEKHIITQPLDTKLIYHVSATVQFF